MGLQDSSSDLFKSTISVFVFRDRRTTKYITIASNPAMAQTCHIPNTNLQCYSNTDLLGYLNIIDTDIPSLKNVILSRYAQLTDTKFDLQDSFYGELLSGPQREARRRRLQSTVKVLEEECQEKKENYILFMCFLPVHHLWSTAVTYIMTWFCS